MRKSSRPHIALRGAYIVPAAHIFLRAHISLRACAALRFGFLLALVAVLPLAARGQVCTTPGRDGVGGTLSGVINTYYPGANSPSAGATSISLGSPVGALATPIRTGDLLLVIQMQDAQINSTNTNAYGDGAGGDPASGSTSVSNSGRFEYVIATTNAGASVSIRGAGGGGGLVYSYANADATGTRGARRFQVVRVPQYSSATLSSSVTAEAWNGRTGGVLVFDVAGTLGLGGASVSVNGRGFRGGAGRQLTGDASGGTNSDYRNLSTYNFHGQKGEGIAGTPRFVYESLTGLVTDTGVEGYPNGSTGMGAPGTAGGGGTDGHPVTATAGLGNDENPGGGGGANGGAGGRGGDTWYPHATGTRRATGGFGGAAFPASATRVVMGGGGGAGTRNNSPGIASASSGGSGGGIVIMRVGAVSGSATINANGMMGVEPQNDGGGGGGAGGSVIAVSTNGASLAGLTINARGAAGTNADLIAGSSGEAHGPGGGGAGGVIVQTGGASANVTGAAAGTTSEGQGNYGATGGANGFLQTISATGLPGVRTGSPCFPQLTVTKATSTATSTPGGTATYTINVVNTAGRGAAQSVTLSDALPGGFTHASSGAVTLNGGATRPTTSNPAVGATAPAFSSFEIPGGGSVALTFTVNIAANVVNETYQNPATATYLDPTRTTSAGTTSASYVPASSAGEDVTINVQPPNIGLVKSVTPNGTQLPGTELTYTVAFTNTGGRAAASFRLTDPDPATTLRLNTNTDFRVGSVVNNLGTTGLTVTVAYSNDNGATFAYVPVSQGGGAPAGFDRNVTHVRWTFAGNLSQTAPNNTGQVSFAVRIR